MRLRERLGESLNMPLKAIFLGSLGTLAETSELRRRALNAAFDEAALGWSWSAEEYHLRTSVSSCEVLAVAAHARARGVQVDAAAICQRQGELFRDLLAQVRMPPRPGLKRLIDSARAAHLKLALVTTADPEELDAMLAVTGLDRTTFSFVGDATTVAASKPAPDIYLAALDALSVAPQETMAIEEAHECAETARALGINCVAFPGALHVGPPLAAEMRRTTPQLRIARSA